MKFAVLLSGCGQFDGSETHEVITTLLSMTQENVEWVAFAPEIKQSSVINHVTNKPEPSETRDVLKESARLVRGNIQPIKEADLNAFDAVVIPGGFGAVTNLCNWSEKGSDFTFEPTVEAFLNEAKAKGKPMGFICIAPVMIPKLFSGAKLTIGNDKAIAEQINAQGSEHVDCVATECVVDEVNKIVSTPANMVAKDINEVYQGIHQLVKALVRLSH